MRLRRALLALALLCPLLLVAGIYLGGHPQYLPGAARDALVADSDAQLYEEALDLIAADYYRPVDRRKLLNRSLGAAVESLRDDFSNYFTPTDYTDFQQSTNGEFVGIGISVEAAEKLKRGLKVLQVYDGSPAKRAGLKTGDLVTKVDGRTTVGQSTEAVTGRIKGPEGTTVSLTFGSGDRLRTARVKRARVSLPIVQSRMERKGSRKTAYVSLSSFTSGAHGELGAAVRKLIKQGATGVVLDLRNNGGGLLNEAVLISSVFIAEGTIVSTEGRAKPKRVYKATGGAIDADVPIVVLVNGGSASASEIVTGALQDRKRATVVGTKTFGKGVFQEVKQLSNGGALDITVGEYFLPSGRNLGGGGVRKGAGIKPDVAATDDPKTPDDEALDRALEAVGSAAKL